MQYNITLNCIFPSNENNNNKGMSPKYFETFLSHAGDAYKTVYRLIKTKMTLTITVNLNQK